MTRRPADPDQAKPPKSIARWVAGIVAVCSSAATIYGLFSDKRVAVFGFIGMIVGIVLLVVVQRAIRAVSAHDATFYDLLVKGLIVFVLIYFMVLTAALFPFLYKWLTGSGSPVNPVVVTPTPVEDKRSPYSPMILSPSFRRSILSSRPTITPAMRVAPPFRIPVATPTAAPEEMK
jgi:hypothetical protein